MHFFRVLGLPGLEASPCVPYPLASLTSLAGLLFLLVSVAPTATAARPPGSDGCRVFVLAERAETLSIEPVVVADGETKVFASDIDPGIVDLILPVGPGGSGRVAEPGPGRLLIARCAGGEMTVIERVGGEESRRPSRRMGDLSRYDIRVNVIGGGHRQVFLIREYEEAMPEVGPVQNPFVGKVPLGEGDYVVFTETYLHRPAAAVYGRATGRLDRWVRLEGTIASGASGEFVVDLGAATTVVQRSFLPDDTVIEEVHMMEHSAQGMRTLKYRPGGATGAVDTVLGTAHLAELRFAELVFEDVDVIVLEEFPGTLGELAGIVGLDLLRRAERLFLELPAPDARDPVAALVLADAATPDAAANAVELPFSLSNRLWVDGSVEGTPVAFVLDTGAPDSFVSVSVAEELGWDLEEAVGDRVHGIDGAGTEAWRVGGRQLQLADVRMEDVVLRIADLPVLAPAQATDQHAGLLGMSLLRRFASLEIDFERRLLRLHTR